MHEHHEDRVHPEPVVFDIGGDIGGLILYTKPEMKGREIEVSIKTESKRVHVEVLERLVNGQTVFAAAYPNLRQGQYDIWSEDGSPADSFTIVGGEVATLDWR